jgi:hypothetical protein
MNTLYYTTLLPASDKIRLSLLLVKHHSMKAYGEVEEHLHALNSA